MPPEHRLTGLPPIHDTKCRILILGSFPSPASLAAEQYYGHPKNQFWPLLAAIMQEPLPELDYAERIERVRAHRIGIWDVYRSCVRPGALDADIRAGTANDFPALFPHMPHLERLCFNGQTAGKFAPRLFDLAASILPKPPEIHILPSSSPAYTLAFGRKLEVWQRAMTFPASVKTV
ncbi:MAG: DNA-deoxyinosine glycosylase [Zoogloeaceae bacterium]|nr:DNA-deoxyinosine glycosylase [Zoogloeaceae bacterium]